MKTKYSLDKIDDYLYLKISGEFEITEFLSYPKILKEICEKENRYKVLVNALDVVKTDASTMDRFFLGEEVAKFLGPKIKLAAVWPEKDINKFAETVAVNRGSTIAVFGDLESAKKWLL